MSRSIPSAISGNIQSRRVSHAALRSRTRLRVQLEARQAKLLRFASCEGGIVVVVGNAHITRPLAEVHVTGTQQPMLAIHSRLSVLFFRSRRNELLFFLELSLHGLCLLYSALLLTLLTYLTKLVEAFIVMKLVARVQNFWQHFTLARFAEVS